MKMLVLSAFSLNMVDKPALIAVREVTLREAQRIAGQGLISSVGHVDTAAIFESLLGVPVHAARTSIFLEKGREAMIGQYCGPRLVPGTKELPAGGAIQWLIVKVC